MSYPSLIFPGAAVRRRPPFRLLPIALAMILGAAAVPAQGACLPDDHHSGGAIYRICMPASEDWNGDLVIFAHGYVAFDQPLAIPEAQLDLGGGLTLPDLVNALGFAFATTSYRDNGLAVVPAVRDVVDLVKVFQRRVGLPQRVYLTGASEGGLVTALAVEQHPELFAGGIAACGPIGSFRGQVNYWGDFRVLFDYFFPGLMPGSPVEVPEEVIAGWAASVRPAVEAAIAADPVSTQELLAVSRAPVDPEDDGTIAETVLGLAWYNVFATNDGVDKLKGQPYGNTNRVYRGSSDDDSLNATVARFAAEAKALREMSEGYETTGSLAVPLITLHTVGDPIIPFWQQPLYAVKVFLAGSGAMHLAIPIARYGHCAFTPTEMVAAFFVLLHRVGSLEAEAVARGEAMLAAGEDRSALRFLLRHFGVPERLTQEPLTPVRAAKPEGSAP